MPRMNVTITKTNGAYPNPRACRVVAEFDPCEFDIYESSGKEIARILVDALKHRRELARIAGREQGALQILITTLQLAKREIEKLHEQVAVQFVDPVLEGERED